MCEMKRPAVFQRRAGTGYGSDIRRIPADAGMCVKSASIAFSSLDFDDAKRLNSPNAFHQTSKQKSDLVAYRKKYFVCAPPDESKRLKSRNCARKTSCFSGAAQHKSLNRAERMARYNGNQSAATPKNALRFGSSMARICVPSERRRRAQTAYLLVERADVSGALSASIST